MYFETFGDLLHMDGHGFYVWSTYCIAAVVLFALAYNPIARKRRILKQVTQAAAVGLTAESDE